MNLERKTRNTKARRARRHDEMRSRWYLAILVVSSKIDGHASPESAVDLQYHLIRAEDHEEAYERAIAIGREQATSYRNVDGQAVKWDCFGLRQSWRERHGSERTTSCGFTRR